MSDFYGCLETTSFQVKDAQALKDDPDFALIKRKTEGFFDVTDEGIASAGWYGQYPSPQVGDEDDEDSANLIDVIHRHIKPGEICRISVSGNEKLRYIGGAAWYVTSKGFVDRSEHTEWDTHLTQQNVLTDAEFFLSELRKLCASKRKGAKNG